MCHQNQLIRMGKFCKSKFIRAIRLIQTSYQEYDQIISEICRKDPELYMYRIWAAKCSSSFLLHY